MSEEEVSEDEVSEEDKKKFEIISYIYKLYL